MDRRDSQGRLSGPSPQTSPEAPPRTTRVLVVGDRGWACTGLARKVVARLRDRYGEGLVVALAGAGGVAGAFEAEARAAGVRVEAHPAGPPLDGAAFVVACHRWLSGSRATADVVRAAMAADIRCYLIEAEDRKPRRIREAP